MSTTDLVPVSRCTRCGADLEPGARFCSSCGQAIDAEPTEPEPTYWRDTSSQWGAATPSAMPPPSAVVDSGGIGKLFSGTGRISRLEYFLTVLGVWGVLIVTWLIIVTVDAPLFTLVAGIGTWLPAMVIAICAGIKRLHDFDQSGWLYLLFLVPFASFIMLLILLFKGPSPGRNRYGFEDSGSVMG